jgi:hypothetical protein
VDCIHWVDRAQLPLLEFVMKDLNRVGVGIMAAGNVSTTTPLVKHAPPFNNKIAQQVRGVMNAGRSQISSTMNLVLSRRR